MNISIDQNCLNKKKPIWIYSSSPTSGVGTIMLMSGVGTLCANSHCGTSLLYFQIMINREIGVRTIIIATQNITSMLNQIFFKLWGFAFVLWYFLLDEICSNLVHHTSMHILLTVFMKQKKIMKVKLFHSKSKLKLDHFMQSDCWLRIIIMWTLNITNGFLNIWPFLHSASKLVLYDC